MYVFFIRDKLVIAWVTVRCHVHLPSFLSISQAVFPRIPPEKAWRPDAEIFQFDILPTLSYLVLLKSDDPKILYCSKTVIIGFRGCEFMQSSV